MAFVVRNTFLEVASDEGVEAISQAWAQRGASKFRSKSADSVRSGSKVMEDTTSDVVNYQLVRLNQLLEKNGASASPKNRVSFDSAAVETSEQDAISLSELMQLQRKLQQALVPSGMPNVRSNNSISTMRSILSNNSISTMCSLDEDDELLEMEAEAEESSNSPTSTSRARVQQKTKARVQDAPFVSRAPASKVPRSLDLVAEYSNADVPKTTIMIRNIPNRYSQRELLLELEENGFSDTFDFLYIPMDKCTRANLGYAFVNFLEQAWAEKCMGKFQNYRFKRHRDVSNKIAAVSVAHIQGLEANLSHYANSVVNSSRHKQRRPVVLAKVSKAL
jgi:hypothetical protein